MYDPASGRFQTKDSWQGDYNRPLSLNRWMYVEGNPVNRIDPSGKCWYGDPSTGKIEIDPFEGGPSEPCEWFVTTMNKAGINVSTPQNWFDSLPENVRGALLSCRYEGPTFEITKPYDPNVIGPEMDKGLFIKSKVVSGPEKYMSASGTVTENTETNGAVGTLTVTFKYHASYIIKIYEKAVDLLVGYTYSDLTPNVSHTAAASLQITYQNGKNDKKGLGSLGTGSNIYTSTQFNFYGKNNFPMELLSRLPKIMSYLFMEKLEKYP